MLLRTVLPGVSLIDLPQVNAWLLHRGSEAMLLDTGLYWDRRKLVFALDEALAGGVRLTSILLTHGHCDHAGSVAFLAHRFGAKVCAHPMEEPYIATQSLYGRAGWQRLMFTAGEVFLPVRRCPVDVLLNEGDRIGSPIGPLTVLHTPGHTPGHVSFYHETDGLLFSGDAILNVIPFVRKTALTLSVPIFSSDMEQAHASALRLVELAPRALLSGHGWPLVTGTADALRAFGRGLFEPRDAAGFRTPGSE